MKSTEQAKLNYERFAIPVNPEYDWGETPESQADYVNPVEAANKLMDYSNAYIEVTMRVVRNNASLAEARAHLKRVETDLARLRSGLLRLHPPGTADRKSNLLLEAYLDRIAFEAGQAEAYRDVEDALRVAEGAVDALERKIESGKQMAFMLKTLGEHVQTFLSFRKHEHNQLRGQ